MNTVRWECRLRPWSLLAIPATLYLYSWDTVLYMVRNDHAIVGYPMKVDICISIPKSSYKSVTCFSFIWDNTIWLKRFVDKECSVLWVHEYWDQIMRSYIYNTLQNKCVGWQSHGAMKTQAQRAHLSYQKHMCLKEGKPHQKLLDLPALHLFYMGLS